MKRIVLGFIFLVIILTSCDSGLHSKGTVIDNKTHKPIMGAQIIVKGPDTTYTDSLGNFETHGAILGIWTDLEIQINKKGYLPKYINFNKLNNHSKDSNIIILEPTSKTIKPSISEDWIVYMYYFNMIFLSIFNFFTIIFIIASKSLKKRYLWVLGIFLFNFTFYFYYFDLSLINFEFINGPFYITHYYLYPFSVKIIVPIIPISFWLLYFFGRKHILKQK